MSLQSQLGIGMHQVNWQAIVAEIRARSGTEVQQEISAEAAAKIEELTGAVIPANQRRFISHLPEVEFAPGLTDAEIAAVENQFGFRFPPDLRAFLQTALPRGERFPDWRHGNEAELREWLEMPLEGILFDVQHNQFWLDEWGPRPGALSEALRITREQVAAAPRLIPVFAHRMMPDEPHAPGNPVFSVHQTDIIHYGADLASYLRNEFNLTNGEPQDRPIRNIRFWDVDRFQAIRWRKGSAVFDQRAQADTQAPGVRRKWWQFWK